MGLFASTLTAKAQSSPQVRASIPFAFQVGSMHMPAGLYVVSLRSEHLVFLQSQGPGKQASTFVVVTPSENGKIQRNGRLVFHRYGEEYFLREVWEAQSKQGIAFAPSRQENEILRTQNQQTGKQTQLAVNTEPKR